MRRVALAGEREEDPSPEALITAGAQLVLPAAAAEELGGRLWAAATAADADVYSTVTVFARLRGWSTLRPRSRAIR